MEAIDYRPTVRPDLSWSDVDDGGVVFDSSSDKIHTLNITAAYVWTLSDGSHTVDEIVREISNICEQAYETVLIDVEKVLEIFRKQNLLTSNNVSS